jgi:hypothetical protein
VGFFATQKTYVEELQKKDVGIVEEIKMSDAALAYAANGWRIVPLHAPLAEGKCSCGDGTCSKVGKHPRGSLTAATNDKTQVAQWWKRWPEANIGLTLSQMLVLDVDARTGGLETLATFEAQYGHLDRVGFQHTGGNGFHFLFRHVEAAKPRSGLIPGLDIKTGVNAYIVVEPSIHASGERYKWIAEPHALSHPANEIQLPVAPAWVQGLALGRKPKLNDDVRRAPRKSVEAHVLTALTEVASGAGRNDTGLQIFCRMRDEGYTKVECKELVSEWVRRANDATPEGKAYTTSEAVASLNSAFSRPPREPKKPKRIEDAESLSALTAEMSFFHDPRGDSYAKIQVDAHSERWPIKSNRFKQVLLLKHYDAKGELPNTESLQNCLAICDLKGQQGEEKPVFVRIGHEAGRICLDLGTRQWEAVEIDKDGWRVTANSAVNFRRPSGLLSLPTPIEGGSLDEFRDLINAADDDIWTLTLAWLVGCFQPLGAMCALLLQGSQGSGKSTMATLLRRLIDPCAVSLESPPKEDRELAITCLNSGIVAFDNLSGLPSWLSDALCRVASGSGFKTRSLYANEDQRLFDLRAPLLLNGIDDIAQRADLLDRCIGLNLPKISDAGRKTERGIYAAFDEAHARILGALLTAVSEGLKNISSVEVVNAPRMVDFAHWVVACENALPIPGGSFLAAFRRNRYDAARNAVEDDPFASAVVSLTAKFHKGWKGTASALLTELNMTHGEGYRLPERWPRDASSVSRWLRRAEPQLKLIDVVVSTRREGKNGGRVIQINRAPMQGELISIDARRATPDEDETEKDAA